MKLMFCEAGKCPGIDLTKTDSEIQWKGDLLDLLLTRCVATKCLFPTLQLFWFWCGRRADAIAMFKKVKQPDFIVGHRLKGANAKRDPLLDEKVGTNKRSRDEDGSSSVVYKETPEEKRARLKAEKDAEKELRDAQKRKKQGLGPSKASILGLPDPTDDQEGEEKLDVVEEEEEVQEKQNKTKLSAKDMKDTLASFKDRLLDCKTYSFRLFILLWFVTRQAPACHSWLECSSLFSPYCCPLPCQLERCSGVLSQVEVLQTA